MLILDLLILWPRSVFSYLSGANSDPSTPRARLILDLTPVFVSIIDHVNRVIYLISKIDNISRSLAWIPYWVYLGGYGTLPLHGKYYSAMNGGKRRRQS